MAPRAALAVALALLATAGSASASLDLSIAAVSPKGLLPNAIEPQTVSLSSALGRLRLGEDAPAPVVVLARGAIEAAMFEDALEEAASWVKLPHVHVEGASTCALSAVRAALPAGAVTFGCEAAPSESSSAATLTAASGALAEQRSAGTYAPVVACVAAGSASSALATLSSSAPERPVALVLAPAAGAAAASLPVASTRRLQQFVDDSDEFAPVDASAAAAGGDEAAAADPRDPSAWVCDAKCWRQVKYLEGFVVFVTVVLTVLVGLTCMNMVDTPTRWGTPKEERHHHHE